MTDAPPIRFAWDGESFSPASEYFAKLADQHYVIGETYQLVEHNDRSTKTHNHYFASIADAWRNIPDHLLEEYPTPEHLRKKALIRKGYSDERSMVCTSKAEALRLAAFVRPMDQYAIIVAREAVVKVYTAQSQKKKAMGAETFQKSKQDVFDYIDDLLGVERGETKKHAGRAA